MKQSLLIGKVMLSLFFVFFHVSASAQCELTCPANVTVPADPATGKAKVNYSLPAIPSGCVSVQTQTKTFNYTGSVQTFTVPAGVSQVRIKAWGAQGGGNVYCDVTGGLGGAASANVAVTPGEQLLLYVGGQPETRYNYSPTGYPGGYNGGGSHDHRGGGGGGASDVRRGGNGLDDRIIVAGGGGGTGFLARGGFFTLERCPAGGSGGGLAGEQGGYSQYGDEGGGGGTQTSGGAAGSWGQPGTLGRGGNSSDPSGAYYSGGGGGYYGGGSAVFAAGGGGSGYIGGSGVLPVSLQAGVNTGHGKIEILYEQLVKPTRIQIAGFASGSTFPVGTTTNTFALKDLDGNTITTCSFTITVLNVRCGPKNDKVLVCHKDAKGKRSTLCVNKQDVANHLAHGDYLGECSRSGAAYEVANQEIGVEQSVPGQLTIGVQGNPAPDYFTLVPSSNSTQPLTLRVRDASGKIIETRENIRVQGAIELGQSYRSGMYFVEVRQGQQRITLKLVKSPY